MFFFLFFLIHQLIFFLEKNHDMGITIPPHRAAQYPETISLASQAGPYIPHPDFVIPPSPSFLVPPPNFNIPLPPLGCIPVPPEISKAHISRWHQEALRIAESRFYNRKRQRRVRYIPYNSRYSWNRMQEATRARNQTNENDIGQPRHASIPRANDENQMPLIQKISETSEEEGPVAKEKDQSINEQ